MIVYEHSGYMYIIIDVIRKFKNKSRAPNQAKTVNNEQMNATFPANSFRQANVVAPINRPSTHTYGNGACDDIHTIYWDRTSNAVNQIQPHGSRASSFTINTIHLHR